MSGILAVRQYEVCATPGFRTLFTTSAPVATRFVLLASNGSGEMDSPDSTEDKLRPLFLFETAPTTTVSSVHCDRA